MSVTVIRIDGSIEIGGKGFPVTQFSVTYGRNNVPSGSVIIPTGRRYGGLQLELEDILKRASADRVPAKLHARGKVLFDGYITAPSFERTFGSAGAQVSLAGWHSDLMATSALSSRFSATTPGNLLQPSCMRTPDGSTYLDAVGAGATRGYWGSLPDLFRLISLAVADLASPPLPGAEALVAIGAAAGDTGSTAGLIGNQMAVAAFNRIRGDLILDPYDSSMKSGIAATISRVFLGDSGGPTCLSKLITAAGLFGFAFIPKVSSALLVAAFPFSSETFVTVSREEYTRIEATLLKPYPVRDVALIGYSTPAASPKEGQRPVIPVRLGYYDSKKKFGVQEIVQGIPWLTHASRDSESARNTSGVARSRVFGRPSQHAAVPRRVLSRAMGDAFCRWQYSNIAFASRTATVSCAYRDDICPGSSIMISCPDYRGSIPIYGFVEQVTVSADATGATAATTLSLSSIRTADEMAGVEAKHPLYKTIFLGDTLAE